MGIDINYDHMVCEQVDKPAQHLSEQEERLLARLLAGDDE
ncbi:hypothetical protein HNP84_003334 [Thermocatellispora tengchongensis]|uniref:Uncharacterized protein n=1 Tax=Thermocatellispora tengchongensis TaxID=1073253 RepID=A0A840P1N6_9ACTN|nr:YaeQ family protein [Thermocatellispora tengchongensis]MBB5133608.1 hypothetical protein [Thermocatellispora tengchongensis]